MRQLAFLFKIKIKYSEQQPYKIIIIYYFEQNKIARHYGTAG